MKVFPRNRCAISFADEFKGKKRFGCAAMNPCVGASMTTVKVMMTTMMLNLAFIIRIEHFVFETMYFFLMRMIFSIIFQPVRSFDVRMTCKTCIQNKTETTTGQPALLTVNINSLVYWAAVVSIREYFNFYC